MKCKNIKKFRPVIVKPFKHTTEKAAKLSMDLINEKVIVVDLCTKSEIVYVKRSLKYNNFYQIHRKDLKQIK